MKHARIYRPTQNPMQSGKARTLRWVVEIIPDESPFIEPIMGWVGSSDMYRTEFSHSFKHKEDAICFAERNGFTYEVIEPQQATIKIRPYSDNFKYKAT